MALPTQIADAIIATNIARYGGDINTYVQAFVTSVEAGLARESNEDTKTATKIGFVALLERILTKPGLSGENTTLLNEKIALYKPKEPTQGGRKMSRKYCKKTTCKKMGFSQKASCRPYKNCFTRRVRRRRGY
jgi:hypothetical protein